MKGQAAMEYLITYGWVILALGLVIAFILSSNVLGKGIPMKNTCNFGPNIDCVVQAYNKEDSGYIEIGLRNAFGYAVGITDIKATDSNGDTLDILNPAIDKVKKITSGGKVNIEIKTSILQKEPTKINVNLRYITCSANINPDCKKEGMAEHQISGYAIVVPGE